MGFVNQFCYAFLNDRFITVSIIIIEITVFIMLLLLLLLIQYISQWVTFAIKENHTSRASSIQGKRRDAAGEPERKRPLGKRRRRSVYNIKMDLR